VARPADGRRLIDLRALEIAPGEARALDVPMPPSRVTIGGHPSDLRVDGDHATLEATHTHSGWHLRVRADAELAGPCWRCLAPATVRLRGDLSQFSAFGRSADAPFDEDLDCEYLEGDDLDAEAMARDALMEDLPSIVLCRPDCAGLCPNCGADRNTTSCECRTDEGDPRWAALRGLAGRLTEPDDAGEDRGS